MPIYIARDRNGKIESIVLAERYELAYAFFQGRKTSAHVIDTLTENDLREQGVIPLDE